MELILKSSSLYRNAVVAVFDDTDEGLLIRDPLNLKGEQQDMYHKVVELDRIDLLAYKYYGSRIKDASKYWWIIADANNIENPLDLRAFVNKQILIPNILNVMLKIQE